jgi:hypothetical protein
MQAMVLRNPSILNDVKRTPHIKMDIDFFAKRLNLDDQLLIAVLKHAKQFTLQYFIFPETITQREDWREVWGERILRGGFGEHITENLLQSGQILVSIQNRIGITPLRIEWNYPLRGSAHEADLLVFKRGKEDGPFDAFIPWESRFQQKVDKKAWFDRFFTILLSSYESVGFFNGYGISTFKDQNLRPLINKFLLGGVDRSGVWYPKDKSKKRIVFKFLEKKPYVFNIDEGIYDISIRIEQLQDDGRYIRVFTSTFPYIIKQWAITKKEGNNTIGLFLDVIQEKVRRFNDNQNDPEGFESVYNEGVDFSAHRNYVKGQIIKNEWTSLREIEFSYGELNKDILTILYHRFEEGGAFVSTDIAEILGITNAQTISALLQLEKMKRVQKVIGKFGRIEPFGGIAGAFEAELGRTRENTRVPYFLICKYNNQIVDPLQIIANEDKRLLIFRNTIQNDNHILSIANKVGLDTWDSFKLQNPSKRVSRDWYIKNQVLPAIYRKLELNFYETERNCFISRIKWLKKEYN